MNSQISFLKAGLFPMLVLLMGAASQAQVVYTTTYIPGCSNTGTDMVAGGAAGAALGAFVGLVTGARGGALAADAAIGAAAGVVTGAGLSCSQRVDYVNTLNYQMVQPQYWQPYQTATSRVVLLQEGYTANNVLCRTYNSQFLSPTGWVSEETTSCRDPYGHWVMGFNPTVIANVSWHRWQPVPWFAQPAVFVGPCYFGQFYHPIPLVGGVPVVDIYVNAGYLRRASNPGGLSAWHAQYFNRDGSLQSARAAARENHVGGNIERSEVSEHRAQEARSDRAVKQHQEIRENIRTQHEQAKNERDAGERGRQRNTSQ